jgi:flagellin
MTVISSNLNALRSSASLALAERAQSTAATRLSTGLRINSAKDDAAGLAITQKMTSYVRGITIALRNANDGLSFAQTAEAGLQQTTQMVQRMRELAVQSANGAMSSDNRIALQAEFDQLLSEVDNVARTTVFNGINMLKSDQATVLHTGSRAKEVTGLSIERSDTKALGLRGFAPDGEIMSGRVGDPIGLQHNAILLNGKSWTTASAAASLSSTNAASRIASAINANVAEHNVIASAYNFVKGAAPTADTFAAGDLVINGNSVGAAANVGELVTNINRDVAGVMATLNPDGTISLTNNTGEQIEIGAGNAAKAGFVASQTYQGFVNLKSLALEDIKITPANVANGLETNIGFVADLQKIGFNGSAGSQQLRGSAVMAAAMDSADQLLINGVAIGAPAGATASQKAAAINAVADKTGVVAKSTTAVNVALDFTHRPQQAQKQVTTYAVYPGTDNDDKYQITVNGYKISIDAKETGASVSAQTESILGVRLANVLNGVTGASNRASALASGLATIINEDQTMASFVQAEGLADGTLQLTARKAGEAFISDLGSVGKPPVVIAQLPTFTGQTLPSSNGQLNAWSENGINGTAKNVDFQSAGTGVGLTGGFVGRPNYVAFGVGGGGIGGERKIVFNSLDLRDQNEITFDAIRGSDTNGGEDPDNVQNPPNTYPDEGVRFFYSTDGGATRTLIHYLSWDAQNNVGGLNTWQPQTITLPAAAKTANTMLIIEQYATAAVNDHYAIHNLNFTAAPPPATSGTNDEMIFDGRTVQANVVDGSQSFRINGKAIDVTSATDVNQLVSIINAQAPAGVFATADKDGRLVLTSSSGENITVEDLSQQPGKFISRVETTEGVTFTPAAEFKFGGAIESSDVAIITIDGVKLAVTAGSTSAGYVASRVASAINGNATHSASYTASHADDGMVRLQGKSGVSGQVIALNLQFLEANPASAGQVGAGGGVDEVTYDGARPTDGQFVKLLSNGVTSFGSLELSSTTGAEIRIDDLSGGATAAKYGLSAQGTQSALIGGTLNILSQDASGLALKGIDLALSKLDLRLGELGAFQNTLEAKISLLASGGADLEAARSRILDADYARETVQLSKTQILQQAATAMLAQANNQAQVVLSLLR